MKVKAKTIINGIFVKNYFLQGFEMENAMKLKTYKKFENKNMTLL